MSVQLHEHQDFERIGHADRFDGFDRGDLDRDHEADRARARAVVHNPLLGLASARRIAELPPESRAALRALLLELSADAHERAARAWAKHKAPMACYWKAVGVYARHAARICRDHKENA